MPVKTQAPDGWCTLQRGVDLAAFRTACQWDPADPFSNPLPELDRCYCSWKAVHAE